MGPAVVDQPSESWHKVWIIIGFTVLFGAAVAFQLPWVNGPWYWQWPWRRLPTWNFLLFLLAAIPFGLAQFRYHRGREIGSSLLLISLSLFLLELIGAGVQTQPFSLTRIYEVITNTDCTGYFSEAWRLPTLEGLLEQYPALMPDFYLHARNKPPGPLLFHVTMIQLFGRTSASALAGGVTLTALATGVPSASYGLLRQLTGSRETAFHGASLIALTTGLVLFFPMFDQAYPLLTCGLIGAWVTTLRTGKAMWAVLSGLVLALACFFSYSLLVLGAFLLGYTALHVVHRREGTTWTSVVASLAVAIATVAAVYTAAWLTTGFDPIATLASALDNQTVMAAKYDRQWPVSIVFDLLDFGLGLSWMPLLLGLFLLRSAARLSPELRWLAYLAWGQIVLIALTGLLRTETARVWIFLFPLAIIPAALELAHWSFRQRACVYGAMWLLLGLVSQNMIFLRL